MKKNKCTEKSKTLTVMGKQRLNKNLAFCMGPSQWSQRSKRMHSLTVLSRAGIHGSNQTLWKTSAKEVGHQTHAYTCFKTYNYINTSCTLNESDGI